MTPFPYQRILVTGGAGFIGSAFIRNMLSRHKALKIINLDKLTYAGNVDNLVSVATLGSHLFLRGDICDPEEVAKAFRLSEERFDGPIQAVINFAAESHVDRSITDSMQFLRTNVIGTQVLLAQSGLEGVKRFIQISTDEVYGSLGSSGSFTEESQIAPNSPYAASKAAADLLCRSYWVTHGLPIIITRSSNNYGPYQYPEKFIPLIIANALEDKRIPIYGDGEYIRDWIHVEDHCRAIEKVLESGQPGEVYNIGARSELTNLTVASMILRLLGKSDSLLTFVSDRPGHDRRYAIDPRKIESNLGWHSTIAFSKGLADTVKWYLSNEEWLRRVRSGEYRDYYLGMYGARLV